MLCEGVLMKRSLYQQPLFAHLVFVIRVKYKWKLLCGSAID
jgi:hypothetical protein